MTVYVLLIVPFLSMILHENYLECFAPYHAYFAILCLPARYTGSPHRTKREAYLTKYLRSRGVLLLLLLHAISSYSSCGSSPPLFQIGYQNRRKPPPVEAAFLPIYFQFWVTVSLFKVVVCLRASIETMLSKIGRGQTNPGLDTVVTYAHELDMQP